MVDAKVVMVLASIACTVSEASAGISGSATVTFLAYCEAGMVANALWAASIRVISCLTASIIIVMPPLVVETLLPLMWTGEDGLIPGDGGAADFIPVW